MAYAERIPYACKGTFTLTVIVMETPFTKRWTRPLCSGTGAYAQRFGRGLTNLHCAWTSCSLSATAARPRVDTNSATQYACRTAGPCAVRTHNARVLRHCAGAKSAWGAPRTRTARARRTTLFTVSASSAAPAAASTAATSPATSATRAEVARTATPFIKVRRHSFKRVENIRQGIVPIVTHGRIPIVPPYVIVRQHRVCDASVQGTTKTCSRARTCRRCATQRSRPRSVWAAYLIWTAPTRQTTNSTASATWAAKLANVNSAATYQKTNA